MMTTSTGVFAESRNMGSEEEAAETGLIGSEICVVETEHQEGGSDAIERDLDFELSDELKDLLRCLNGNLISEDDLISNIPYLMDKRYGDFFSPHSTCARAGEVRLKVLNALGNCQTLDKIDLWYLAKCDLTVPEWEAFLIPLQSNPALERVKEIIIPSSSSAETETEASISGCMTNILAKAQNLGRLTLFPNTFTGAPHGISAVASGLQASPHLSLHAVITSAVHSKVALDSAGVQQVARLIYATHIHMLELRGFAKLDEVAKKALVKGLRSCTQLEVLRIFGCGEGMVDVLEEAYKGPSSNTPLSKLYIDITSCRVEYLADALVKSVSPNIRKVHLNGENYACSTLSIAEWQNISRFLPDVKSPDPLCTLTSFEISFGNIAESDIISLNEGLEAFWKASQHSPIVSISARIDFSGVYSSFIYSCFIPLISHLTRITVSPPAYKNDSLFETFLESVSPVKLLQTLVIESKFNPYPGLYQHLFQSLHSNTSIKKLDLSYCKLDEDAFKSIMELLQINLTLVEIDVTRTPWVEDGKSAIIDEALRRNMKQAAYLSVLRDANLDFKEAKAGRIFLCGHPLAGKTQLKVTMMKNMGKESESESWVTRTCRTVLGRTKGIEVEMLRDDDSMKISVWDLAGQYIFRALQDLLFPRSGQACIFVFLFNPFENRGGKTVLKESPNNAFESELKNWMRFIASNVQVTGHILPQILVVITHKDKMKKHGRDFFLDNTKETVIELRKEFSNVVDLCPDVERSVRHINAKHKEGVQKITDHLLQWMEGLLRRKTPAAPRACSELISHFSKGLAKVKCSPVWSVDELYAECSTEDSLKSFNSSHEQGKRVLHAVALYLHDMGAIFLIPGGDGKSAGGENGTYTLVVVDPNWLTQNFLGEITSLGHMFEVKKESPDSRSVLSSSHPIGTEGFVSKDQLHSFLAKILEKGQRAGRKVERKHAVKLLLDLDLCYELNVGQKKYFMPTVLGGKDGMDARVTRKVNKLSWGYDNGEEADYFGYRVQCRDGQRTSFTAAFFPRYEIHLRKRLGESINMVDENFIFSRDFVEIRSHSCHIFVELDEHGEDHVDIMVRFLKSRTRDTAIDFVQKHILDELVEFCASPRGCPGVQLVVSILRTDCVRELVPRESRTANVATVLRDELKRNFQEDLEEQIDHGNEDPITNYNHSWPKLETPGGTLQLPGSFEPACILLPSKDVKDVLAAVQRQRDQLRKSLIDLQHVSANLDRVAVVELDLTVAESATKPLPPSGLRGSFRKMDGSSLSEEAQRILHAVEDLKKITSARFRDLQNELKDFKETLQKIRSTMTEVSSKVDATIGYMMSEDDHRTPRRPYFTVDDVSLLQKLRAGVVFSTPVRLHLMCESRNKPHFVPNQPGLKLNLEKSGKHHQWMRTMSLISLKMIWVMLHVGIQITSGLASMVPDISNLATGVSIGVSMPIADFALEQMKLADSVALLEDEAVSEAWCRLRETLAPKLTTDECSKQFNLYRVRYKSSEDPVAWVCDSCMKDGRRNRLLD